MTAPSGDPPAAPKTDDVGGCSVGCAGLFLLALLWPFLHWIGGSYEPDVLMVTFMVGPPAFLVGHVLALLSIWKGSKRWGRVGLIVMWSGIAAYVLMIVVALIFERIGA